MGCSYYTTAPRASSFDPAGVSTTGGSLDDSRSDISRNRWFERRCSLSRLHRAQIAMILMIIIIDKTPCFCLATPEDDRQCAVSYTDDDCTPDSNEDCGDADRRV